MRLTSAMWFAVFMKMETQRGAFVTVIKNGAQQAGALFIVENIGMGLLNLYSPAPQSFLDDSQDATDDRKFECVLENVDQDKLDAYLEKQKNFDPDLWIIETEAGSGKISISVVKD
jgi:hypothetical protein